MSENADLIFVSFRQTLLQTTIRDLRDAQNSDSSRALLAFFQSLLQPHFPSLSFSSVTPNPILNDLHAYDVVELSEIEQNQLVFTITSPLKVTTLPPHEKVVCIITSDQTDSVSQPLSNIAKRLLNYLLWLGFHTRVFCDDKNSDTTADKSQTQQNGSHNYEAVRQEALEYLQHCGSISLVPVPSSRVALDFMKSIKTLATSPLPSALPSATSTSTSPISQSSSEPAPQSPNHYQYIFIDTSTKQLPPTSLPLSEDVVHIRAFVGEQIVGRRVQSPLHHRIAFFLASLRSHHEHNLMFTRHGQSTANFSKLVGTDAPLSTGGIESIHSLHRWLKAAKLLELTLWTSSLKRGREYAVLLPLTSLVCPQLDEIKAGICDGMTYEQIEHEMPDVAKARSKDKLRYRYPKGESYEDVIFRLEPIVLKIERREKPVLLVSHQATLRCLQFYFIGGDRERIPYVDVPENCVIVFSTQDGLSYHKKLEPLDYQPTSTTPVFVPKRSSTELKSQAIL